MLEIPEIKMSARKYRKRTLSDPIAFRTEIFSQYGDIAWKNVRGYKNILVSHPDYIQHILQHNHKNYFTKHAHAIKAFESLLGNKNIFFTSEVEQWKKDSALVKMCFEPDVYFTTYAKIISVSCKKILRELREDPRSSELINIVHLIDFLIIDILNEILIHNSESSDTAVNVDRAVRSTRLLKKRGQSLLPLFWRFSKKGKEFKRIMTAIDNDFKHNFTARIHAGKCYDDLLGYFIHEYPVKNTIDPMYELLKCNIKTLSMLGWLNSSALLHWLFIILAQYPDITQEILKELDRVVGNKEIEYTDLSKMHYLQAVIKETQRLHPSPFAIMREAIDDDTLGGYHIDNGAGITMSTYHLHRHPACWENPENFDPERFLKHPAGQSHPCAYLPFGSGERSCVASSFIMMEMQLIAAMFVRELKLSLPAHVNIKNKMTTILSMRPNVESMTIDFKD